MQAYAVTVVYTVEAPSAESAKVAAARHLEVINSREDIRNLFFEGGVTGVMESDELPEAIGPATVYGLEDLAAVVDAG